MSRQFRKIGPVSRAAIGVMVCAVSAVAYSDPTTVPSGVVPPAATQPQAGVKPAPKPTQETKTCVSETCHASILNRKVMHGPTAQQKCQSCHQYADASRHQFKLAQQAEKLCETCHTIKQRTVVHAPVSQGRCTGCHDPHGSDQRFMLVADPTKGLCLTCHKQTDFAKLKFVHGPVASGACIVCHEPHSSWEAKLLVKPAGDLCVQCHSEVARKTEANGQDRHLHAPVKDQSCAACHDPHASNNKFQLRQAAPDLCFSCHKELQKTLASAKVVHGAVTQEGGCLTCHSAHASTLPKLAQAAQPKMCLSCHNQPLKTASGQTLTDMAALLKDNPQHHGPIREGACTACHQPHANDRFRLLSQDYPPDFYAPFAIERYALCFGCHIPQLVTEKHGTGLTRFRQGDVNLHWVHVNQPKGRTCRACHEVHASQNPFHIRDAVPFGTTWMLEIGYKQNSDGGSCSPGCHVTRTYNNGPTTQPSTRPAGDTR
jgi:predicted CXXCH cytochrome family protein